MRRASLANVSDSPPSGLRRKALAASTGVLLGLGFPPFPFPVLAWGALVPLLLLWTEQPSARKMYMDASVAFLITFLVAFQWPLLHHNPDTALLSLPAMVAIPLWMAVPFGISSACRKRLGKHAALALLVTLFILMEWSLRRGPLALPWALLGHSQAELFPLNRLARFGGAPLLTAFVLAANVLGAAILLSMKRPIRKNHGRSSPVLRLLRSRSPAIVSGAVVAAGLIAAFLPPDAPRETGQPLTIALIQPGISAETWADFDDTQAVRTLLAMYDALDPDTIDLAIWPETALPPGNESLRELVRRRVEVHGIPLLTGAIDEAPVENPDHAQRPWFNAARYMRPGKPEAVYRKRRLVPFAEGVPFENRWPLMRRLAIPAGGVAGYLPGTSPARMDLDGIPFGVLICFETLFDDTAREYARDGAQFLIAITQDGWWKNSFGYRQHLAFNRLRAIETGRPFVQTSVSGSTASVRPDGAIEAHIGWMERRVAIVRIEPATNPTPYMRWGDVVSPVAGVIALILSFMAFVRLRR